MTNIPSDRFWKRTFLDIRHRFGRRRSILLDVHRSTHHLHQLERGRTQQFPIREWRGRELPRAVEQGRQRTEVERLTMFVWDVFRVWSATVKCDKHGRDTAREQWRGPVVCNANCMRTGYRGRAVFFIEVSTLPKHELD